MAQLSANRPVPNTLQQRMDLAGGVVVDMVMTVSTTIYEGAFVGYVPATGTVHPLVDGDAFAGIALKKVVSDATAGSTKVPVYAGGYFQHAVTASAVTSNGAVVFATSGSTDNVLDLTSTTMPAVGRVESWVTGTTCVIKAKSAGYPSGSSATPTVITAVEG